MKIVLGLLAAAGVAATANASITATYQEIGGDSVVPAAPGPSVYLGTAGPYSSFAAATGIVGTDQYISTQTGSFNMSQFVFVGGVANVIANGSGGFVTNTLFEFFDTSGALSNSFTVALPQAGNFIWTITLGADPDGLLSTFVVPSAGFVRMSVAAAHTGKFFLTQVAPTIGANPIGVLNPGNATFNHAFEMRLAPTPGSLALLGLGGLAAARRRR